MSYRSYLSGNYAGNAISIKPHNPSLTVSITEKRGEEKGCMDVPVCHLWLNRTSRDVDRSVASVRNWEQSTWVVLDRTVWHRVLIVAI